MSKKSFNKIEIESVKKKLASSKGFETRDNAMKSKAWEQGPGYGSADRDVKAKQRAKASVVEELEQASKKDLTKAENILSEIMSDMTFDHILVKNVVFPLREKENIDMQRSMIVSTKEAIDGLTKMLSIVSLCLFTGVVDVLLPLSKDFSLQSVW